MLHLIVAPAALALLTGERDFSAYSFTQYKATHGKVYDEQEDIRRKSIFEANLALVNTHNAAPQKTWFAAADGPFADWTNDEFRALRTGTFAARTKHGATGAGAGATPLPSKAVAIDDRKDWREIDGVVTDVKDQKSCGSCWAFSAVETFESHLAIATGEAAPVLSEQQVVSCSPNPDQCGGSGGCQGSTQPLAFNYTMTAGMVLEEAYPYKARTGTCDGSKEGSPVAINGGYVELERNNYTALMSAVATIGPVAISVAAGGLGWQLYGGGVYDGGGTGMGSCGFVMDHGIQLVGYGSDGGKDYWLVRNSWGGRWGESGYMRLQRFGEGNEPCGMDKRPQDGDACKGDTDPIEYCGLCAILSSSSYPTGVKKL